MPCLGFGTVQYTRKGSGSISKLCHVEIVVNWYPQIQWKPHRYSMKNLTERHCRWRDNRNFISAKTELPYPKQLSLRMQEDKESTNCSWKRGRPVHSSRRVDISSQKLNIIFTVQFCQYNELPIISTLRMSLAKLISQDIYHKAQ